MIYATGFLCLLLPLALCAPLSIRNKLLLVSFDGFRWDYDRDVDTPHLDAMATDGVKAAYVTPPFITITSPSHFTLLTGRYIENHGVIHNMWFNTSTHEKKPYYQTQFVNEWWDNGSIPIWITAQRQGRRAGSLHFPGTASTYQGERVRVREVEPPFYNYANETAWRESVDKVMASWFMQEHVDFVSLYFGEPDGTGHKYGPDSEERKAMVRQVDRTVGYIRSTAQHLGLAQHLNIIITADHGMSSVLRGNSVTQIFLSKLPGFSFSDLAFHLVDFGPVGMLLPHEGRLEKVYHALKGAHAHLHVYRKEELPKHLHFSKHQRILPLVLIADPGYVINGLLPLQFNKGEHGFDSEVMDMKPFFRAVGPDFRSNATVDPFETVHVYPLMCHLLDVEPEDSDGRLEVTELMLVSSGSGAARANTRTFTALSLAAGLLLLLFTLLLSYSLLQRRAQHRCAYALKQPACGQRLQKIPPSAHDGDSCISVVCAKQGGAA